MDIDSVAANHESYCNLLVGQSTRHQAQYLDFTRGAQVRTAIGNR